MQCILKSESVSTSGNQVMDFQSAMETFAEAWVAANSGKLSLGLPPGSSATPEFLNELPPSTSTGSTGAHNSSFTSTTTLGSVSATATQQQLASKGGGFSAPAAPHNSGNNSEPPPIPTVIPGESEAVTPLSLSLLYANKASSSSSGGGIDLSHPRRFNKTGQPPQQPQKKMSISSASSSGPSHQKANATEMGSEQQQSHSTIGKSMPIHCIIEVSRDAGEMAAQQGSPTATADESISQSAKDCPTERESTPRLPAASTPGGRGSVEVDDFVIIPVGTPFHDLVTTVLTLHGYPKDIIRQAEGTISLRNWKPLRLDQVCDSRHKTVGDILNDLTNHATLRVLVTRSKGGSADELKEKLLRLLLAQSSSLLMGAGGCPLDEVSLGSLVKGQWSNNLAEDVKRRFDQWYASQQQQTVSGLVESLQQHHHQQILQQQSQALNSGALHPTNGNSLSSQINAGPRSSHLLNGSSELRERVLQSHQSQHLSHHHAHQSVDTTPTTIPHHLHHHSSNGNGTGKGSFLNDENNELLPHHHLPHHPVFHGLSTQKTRMRTSFDPEMELPKLQQWFADNPHPSRHQIQQYVRDLNLLECRKDRKPLDVNNVIYWFKNARAAQKRNELRYNGLPSHHGPFPHSLHHPQSQDAGSHRDRSHYPRHSSPENSHHLRRSSSPAPSNHMDFSEDHNNNHDLLFDHNNGDSRHSESSCSANEGGVEKSPEVKVVVKEEPDEDFISVDVEMNEGAEAQHNEPRDLSSKSPERDGEGRESIKQDTSMEEEQKQAPEDNGGESSPTSSASLSPRSSPGMSPNPHFDFAGPPSMINRFHPFFDHPSFMASYRHFNSFNFGQGFPGSGGPGGLEVVGGNSSAAVAAAAAAAYQAALSGRKSHPLAGKRSPGSGNSGLDIFHDYPQGARMPSHDPACHPDIPRLRGEDLFASRQASSAEIISSIINSNRGELGLGPIGMGGHHIGHGHPSPNSLAMDERRKRNRTFIDPVTEVPRLEQWFGLNTHPSHNLILKYTDELNRMPYRQKFPKLEPKNVQFWFKNRRAKCKRLKMTM